MDERVLVRTGLRNRYQCNQEPQSPDQRPAAIAECMHSSVPPALSEKRGGIAPPLSLGSDGGDQEPAPHFLVAVL